MVKFFKCSTCGNFVETIHITPVPMMCCGKKMDEIVPNTVDASFEKHIPDVKIDGDIIHVQVGSTIHPMTEEHYIEWILVETEKGLQRKDLKPNEEPIAYFVIKDDKAIAVYAYCNLHGLWKFEIK